MAYDGTKPQDNSYIADGPAEIRENLRALKEDKIVNAQKLSDLEPGHSNGNIPVSDGVLNQGLNAELLNGYSVSAFAASNHVHSAVTSSSNGFMLNTDKVKLDDIESGAEVNQNAFATVSVTSGGTTTSIAADGKQDTLALIAGTGIVLTPNATNDSVTMGVTDIPAQLHASGNDMQAQTPNTTLNIEGNGRINSPETGYSAGISACFGGSNPNGISEWARSFWMYGQWNGSNLWYGSRKDGSDHDIVWKQIAFTDSNITGNAATATSAAALTVARNINGVPFDGSEDVSINSCPGTFTAGTVGSDEGGQVKLSEGSTGSAIVIDNYYGGTFRVFQGNGNVVRVLNMVDSNGGWNCNAPKPTTSSGVGQIASQGVSQTFTLPAGGTWEVWGDVHNNNSTANGSVYQIVAGGTTVNAGDSQTRTNWFAKRIS